MSKSNEPFLASLDGGDGDVHPDVTEAIGVLTRQAASWLWRKFTRKDGVEPWITVAEGAEHASVSEDTIRKWIDTGQLRAGRHDRVIRVRRSDIDEMLLQRDADEFKIASKEQNPVDDKANEILDSLG